MQCRYGHKTLKKNTKADHTKPAGYQFHPGSVILKLFAGIEVESQVISPRDPNNAVQGTKLGLKLQAEGWYDISERFYLSADASYGTAFEAYCELARVGFRARPKLSFGIEGGALGNEEYDAGRGGGFVRGHFRDVEDTLSGGFTGAIWRTIRAAMSASAATARFERPTCLGKCTAGPAPAVLIVTRPVQEKRHARPPHDFLQCRG